MTRITVHTVVDIAVDLAMMGIGLCLCMADSAGKDRIIAGIRMAVTAGRPDGGMTSAVNRETGVHNPGARPARGRVALRAVVRESGRRVLRVRRPVVIRSMA